MADKHSRHTPDLEDDDKTRGGGNDAGFVPESAEDEAEHRADGAGGEDEDERIAARTGDDDQDHGTDDERRAKRAAARKARKEHRREREAFKDERIAQLEQALQRVESRVGETSQQITTQNVALVDQRLSECTQAIQIAEQAMAKAVKAGDDEGFMAALRTRDAARDAQGQLNYYKQASAAESQRQPKTQAVDARVIDHAKEFAKDNPWFDMNPNTSDRDSRLVFELDKAVKRAGYDEKSPLYWEELQERVDAKLPHRLEEIEERAPARRGNGNGRDTGSSQRRGPALGGGRSGRTGGKGDELPPRNVVDAAKAAGYWNDPKEREDFLKRYKESVAKHGAR